MLTIVPSAGTDDELPAAAEDFSFSQHSSKPYVIYSHTMSDSLAHGQNVSSFFYQLHKSPK